MMGLLEALAQHPAPVNLKQLAGETSLHPSTAHRILGLMVESRLIDGVSCIGAGIHNDEGRLVAGLSVSAPSDRLNKDWATNVQQTADRISRAIGYHTPV